MNFPYILMLLNHTTKAGLKVRERCWQPRSNCHKPAELLCGPALSIQIHRHNFQVSVFILILMASFLLHLKLETKSMAISPNSSGLT